MKALKIICALLFPAVLSWTGCSDSDDLEVELRDEPVSLTLSSTNPYAEISEDGRSATLNFRPFGGVAEFKIISDSKDIEISSGTDTWYEWSYEQGILSVTAPENYEDQEFEGSIDITAGGSAKATISVKQAALGEAGIMISPSVVIMTAGGKYPQEIHVTTNNSNWEFEINCPWLMVERRDDKLILTADPNGDELTRAVDFVITSTVGERIETETVYVRQLGKAYITSNPTALSLFMVGGTVDITVETNQQSWDYTPPTVSWVSVIRSGDILTVNVYNIGDQQDRSTGIILRTGELDDIAEYTIHISQLGIDVDKMIFELTVTDTSAPASIPIHGDVDCTVDWGDGTVEQVNIVHPTHTFASEGVWNVTVSGTVTQLSSVSMTAAQRQNITRVLQWGKTGLSSMESAFGDCTNLQYIPTDLDGSFTEVTTFQNAFYCCNELREIPDGLFDYATKCTSFQTCFMSLLDADNYITYIPEDLFANCPDVTTFYELFRHRTAITELPAKLFENNTKVRDMGYIFYRTGILDIPENIFQNCPEITNMIAAFGYSSIERLPAGLFANNPLINNMSTLFSNCTNLTYIAPGLFDNTPLVTTFQTVFGTCSSLETIPDGLFDNAVNATNFRNIFMNCSSLKEIPEGLFVNCVKGAQFGQAFSGCSSIVEIPATLFPGGNLGAGTNISNNLFTNCTSLKKVPETIFETFVNANNFTSVFQGCTSLEEIPENLFAKCEKMSNITSLFNGCTALKTIPENLFANNPAITSGGSVFYGCSSITEIPANLFANVTAAMNTPTAMFQNCTSLKIIPGNLFPQVATMTNVSNMFNGCTALEQIPGNLFENNPAITNVTSIFQGCTSLKSIPTDMFDANRRITTFTSAFRDCVNVTGSSPYSVVDSQTVHYYERSTHADFTTPTAYRNCFNGCTGLDDYQTMVANWRQ